MRQNHPTFEILNLLPIQILARRTLDESIDIAARLSYSESLNARIRETEESWSGYSDHARALILGALALDLSPDGFISA